MTLSKVRDYIQQRVEAIEPKMSIIDSAFLDDISETKSDKSYFISYDITTTEQHQTHLTDVISASVTFSFKSPKSSAKDFDKYMELVNKIRLSCVNKTNIENFSDTDQNPINNCEAVSQTIEPLSTNKRQLIINLALDFTVSQVIC